VIRLLGNLLVVVGVAGFALVVAMPRLPTPVVEPLSVAVEPVVAFVLGEPPTRPVTITSPVQATHTAITRLVIPSIELETTVVPAALVEHDGLTTWDVPKFVAGHAEGSAGAGEPGNVVLIGHVTSLTLGHVFENLDKVGSGDVVEIFSDESGFDYRVTDVRSIARTDIGVLDPTPASTLTLITCTGQWLPTVHDYTQREVVKAELVTSSR
jgi:LPXTG-site transpeptidase (sortase) family protein